MNTKPLLHTIVMACFIAGDAWADEIDDLTKKYSASVTIVMRRATGFHGYARVTDESTVWVSSGKKKTKIVDAPTKQEIKRLIADQMRAGVMKIESETIGHQKMPASLGRVVAQSKQAQIEIGH